MRYPIFTILCWLSFGSFASATAKPLSELAAPDRVFVLSILTSEANMSLLTRNLDNATETRPLQSLGHQIDNVYGKLVNEIAAIVTFSDQAVIPDTKTKLLAGKLNSLKNAPFNAALKRDLEQGLAGDIARFQQAVRHCQDKMLVEFAKENATILQDLYHQLEHISNRSTAAPSAQDK